MTAVYDCSNDTDTSLQKSSKDSLDNEKKDLDAIDDTIKSIVNHFLYQANSLVDEAQTCE